MFPILDIEIEIFLNLIKRKIVIELPKISTVFKTTIKSGIKLIKNKIKNWKKKFSHKKHNDQLGQSDQSDLNLITAILKECH